MARVPMPENIKKSKSLGVRVTPEQYAWLREEARSLSEAAKVPVTASAIVGRIITQAMEEAGA